MTAKEIAESPQFRAELHQALQHPCIRRAIECIQKENMPSKMVIALAPGCDAMQSVALDYAQKVGAQAVIDRLFNLPYLTNEIVDRGQKIGKPWEWLGEEIEEEKKRIEAQVQSAESTKPKNKKK